MADALPPGSTVGILGGGQLGLGPRLGLPLHHFLAGHHFADHKPRAETLHQFAERKVRDASHRGQYQGGLYQVWTDVETHRKVNS